MESIAYRIFGAEEGTRTPTPLRVHGPEPCASANSATSARGTCLACSARRAATLSLANAVCCVKSARGWEIGAGKSAPPSPSFQRYVQHLNRSIFEGLNYY